MFAGGGKEEQDDVPGGMPQAAQALLPIIRLGVWTTGVGGDGNIEEVIQSPVQQVAAKLLKDVRVSQEQ